MLFHLNFLLVGFWAYAGLAAAGLQPGTDLEAAPTHKLAKRGQFRFPYYDILCQNRRDKWYFEHDDEEPSICQSATTFQAYCKPKKPTLPSALEQNFPCGKAEFCVTLVHGSADVIDPAVAGGKFTDAACMKYRVTQSVTLMPSDGLHWASNGSQVPAGTKVFIGVVQVSGDTYGPDFSIAMRYGRDAETTFSLVNERDYRRGQTAGGLHFLTGTVEWNDSAPLYFVAQADWEATRRSKVTVTWYFGWF